MTIHDKSDIATGQIADFKIDAEKAFTALLSALGNLCKSAPLDTGDAMDDLRATMFDIKGEFIWEATKRAQAAAENLSEKSHNKFVREERTW